jgi:hypothetical protein
MKKLLLLPGVLAACLLVSPASADVFTFGTMDITLSNGFLTVPSAGTVTVTNLGGGVADINWDVAPNLVINAGGHFPLTFSLLTGSVDAGTLASPFFVASGSGPFDNDPFKGFANAIDGNCAPGGNGCGTSVIDFHVTGYTGLSSINFNGTPVFLAGDILDVACQAAGGTACTGAVGATNVSVPGPIVGAGLPGLVAACFGMIGLARRRRNKAA